MKLGFVVTEVPPSVYYSGEGKCRSYIVPVEIPDEYFPEEIIKLANKSEDYKHLGDVMIVKESK